MRCFFGEVDLKFKDDKTVRQRGLIVDNNLFVSKDKRLSMVGGRVVIADLGVPSWASEQLVELYNCKKLA